MIPLRIAALLSCAAGIFCLASSTEAGPAAQRPDTKAPTATSSAPTPGPAASPAAAPSTSSTVLVPAGVFLMGSVGSDALDHPDETPQRRITLKAYRIDRFEVTNAEYRKFLEAMRLRPAQPAGQPAPRDYTPLAKYWDDPEWNSPEKPVIGVDWYDAKAYCEWAGKRLPTEAEWEKAARGTDGRRHPWGEEPIGKVLVGNFADESVKKLNPRWNTIAGYDDGFPHTAPVGSFPKGASPYGAQDTLGNAWEWVADFYSPDAYGDPVTSDPKGPEKGETRVLRGGSWDSTPNWLRTAQRHFQDPAYRGIASGIRCAQDVP